MGRDLENAIVREFTNDAFSSLDSIPTKKYEQALLTETQKHGDIGMNQMVDNIVRDEKRNFDEAVKRVRKSYIHTANRHQSNLL
ncbi:MAG: hypothetical protein IJF84_13225 [Thermoguttaceae bacterium]|nr:hypothetical protein [Thermoguttaceae bacterium]